MTQIEEDATLTAWRAPLGHTARRRRVIGVDVWAEYPLGDQHLTAQARAGAMGTHLFLVAAVTGSDSGVTRHGDGEAALRLRFVARQDDVHLTDEAICELLARLALRLRWSKLAKLEEFDGVPAFAPLPSLSRPPTVPITEPRPWSCA